VQSAPEVVDAAKLFSESGGAARHGTLVHKLAEGLEWLDETGEITDENLEGALRSEGASEEELKQAISAFKEALSRPEIKALLSREGYGSSSEVKVSNERSFSLLLSDEEGVEYFANGSIDRLVLSYAEGEVVSAEVIDFKTDRVREEGVEARARHHAPQMESYRRAVSTMYSLKPELIKLRLAFTAPGVVYDLP
jgi:ATP-dependent exoDNAse (exonuclease V) beta subunit